MNMKARIPVVGLAALMVLTTHVAHAQSQGGRQAAAGTATRADYTSPNFLIHTDLSALEAKELLGRLETMLKLISAYWGKPLRGTIECYVVKDLNNWPAGSIPDEHGRSQIEAGAGVTSTQSITQGNQFIAKSTVFAIADRGTPQHEAVHAYCGQTFGRTGPVWYSEGMAEMGQYWKGGDTSVNCHPYIVEYFRETPPKSLNEIVNATEFTGDSWENYAWRWALCHLLATNKNYSERFRPLGLGLLEKQPVSFEQVYGAMATEISFEYLFFIKHVDIGYRVDLCSWDWKKKFVPLRTASPITVKVDAPRGWQPSGVMVTEGTEYEFSATGTWKTEKGGEAVTGDGGAEGAGRVEGMVMKEFQLGGSLDLAEYLSEPIEMGAYGSFAAPSGGKLYLRCRDEWNKLADNQGKLSVKLKLKAKGNPLPQPKVKKEKEKAKEKPKPEGEVTPAA